MTIPLDLFPVLSRQAGALFVALAVLSACGASPARASSIVETFAGFPAGAVVAGKLPQGGVVANPSLSPNIDLVEVVNNAGPHSAIIFDSSNPTSPDDFDLGTPNETCGGPGIGQGGEVGQPGENCTPYGNLLIVAENLIDENSDNIVDVPDDEADGGLIRFHFRDGVAAVRIILVDVDSEQAEATLENQKLTITLGASDLGDNSVQALELGGIGNFNVLEVRFSGSGAIAQLEFEAPVSVGDSTWGAVKARYR